jgi:hypothetical protein
MRKYTKNDLPVVLGGGQWHYAEAMSHAIRKAQWVAWWPFDDEHKPSPGLYYPDMKTAAATALFIRDVRVCPKCSIPFVSKKGSRRTEPRIGPPAHTSRGAGRSLPLFVWRSRTSRRGILTSSHRTLNISPRRAPVLTGTPTMGLNHSGQPGEHSQALWGDRWRARPPGALGRGARSAGLISIFYFSIATLNSRNRASTCSSPSSLV